ncbi:hypothetical protein EIN_182620, partial [Entamoeba invadens IP1]|uniref:hypothetical protein n=1 Tax=Entamoeba invadens IP1 TaxID=370355 RepID=UPI0002C3DE0E
MDLTGLATPKRRDVTKTIMVQIKSEGRYITTPYLDLVSPFCVHTVLGKYVNLPSTQDQL